MGQFAQIFLERHEEARPEQVKLLFHCQSPGVPACVLNMRHQRKSVITGVGKSAQIVAQYGSRHPSFGLPLGGKRENEKNIKTRKDAQNPAHIEIADGNVARFLRLLEHHPCNQKTAQDKEREDSAAVW